jgi:hypothetical protein
VAPNGESSSTFLIRFDRLTHGCCPCVHLHYITLEGNAKQEHVLVRDVISPQQDLRIGTGSPDRPDLSRALIGGACRSWQWVPPRAAPYKRGDSRGTGTNVHRACSAATNPNPKTDQRGAEARGLAPPRLRDRPTTRRPPTPTDHRRPVTD